MVRDSPELKRRMAGTKSRDSGNTVLHKKFPGGHNTMAGAKAKARLEPDFTSLKIIYMFPLKAENLSTVISVVRADVLTISWNLFLVG